MGEEVERMGVVGRPVIYESLGFLPVSVEYVISGLKRGISGFYFGHCQVL